MTQTKVDQAWKDAVVTVGAIEDLAIEATGSVAEPRILHLLQLASDVEAGLKVLRDRNS